MEAVAAQLCRPPRDTHNGVSCQTCPPSEAILTCGWPGGSEHAPGSVVGGVAAAVQVAGQKVPPSHSASRVLLG